MRSERCFYLTDVGAKGNKKFWALSKKIREWKHPESMMYSDALSMAHMCYHAKKIHRGYKGIRREMIDIWWTCFYVFGIKLNGIDLGSLYLKTKEGKSG